jgi:DNA modification methylase
VTDIYTINNKHRLVHSDSTDIQSVKALFGKNFAKALITDPPYGIEYTGNVFSSEVQHTTTKDVYTQRASGIANDKTNDKANQDGTHSTQGNFRQTLARVFKNTDAILQPGAAIYIFSPISEQIADFLDLWRNRDWHLQTVLTWDKILSAPARYDYLPRTELILYGWRNGAPHLFNNPNTNRTLLSYPRHMGAGQKHPTAKPVSLLETFLMHSTHEEDIVYDPFAGGGSILAAAHRTNRVAYMIELEPSYIDLILTMAKQLHLSIQKGEL